MNGTDQIKFLFLKVKELMINFNTIKAYKK
jgi:hypothetical protein